MHNFWLAVSVCDSRFCFGEDWMGLGGLTLFGALFILGSVILIIRGLISPSSRYSFGNTPVLPVVGRIPFSTRRC